MATTRPDPGPARRPESNGADVRAPFGLDPAETAQLALILKEAVAPLGIDGAALVDGLAQGRPLGQSLGLPPGLPDLLYANAHAWFTAGRADRSEQLFRALCLLQGDVVDHWVGYGVCLRVAERITEASLAFATAVALRPDWAVARFHAASIAIAEGDWSSGADHLDAFERATAGDVPSTMRQDAARLRLAVTQRLGSRPTAGARSGGGG